MSDTLNKVGGRGRESGALKLPKLCVFGLKIRLFWRKKTKNHDFTVIFSVSMILDFEDSILDTCCRTPPASVQRPHPEEFFLWVKAEELLCLELHTPI